MQTSGSNNESCLNKDYVTSVIGFDDAYDTLQSMNQGWKHYAYQSYGTELQRNTYSIDIPHENVLNDEWCSPTAEIVSISDSEVESEQFCFDFDNSNRELAFRIPTVTSSEGVCTDSAPITYHVEAGNTESYLISASVDHDNGLIYVTTGTYGWYN